MTKVYLAYNPFTVKTTMVVNDEPITSTSTLYRYRNTPLQDWVGSFLPELVEHCNDDEIEITFHGLEYHFDELEKQVEAYTSKNRDIEIELHHEVSKSQVARIGALTAMIDEVQNTQELIPEIKAEEAKKRINDSYDARLEMITISSVDHLKVNVVNKLINQPLLTDGNDKGIKIIDNDHLKGIQTTGNDEDFDYVEVNIPFVNSKHVQLIVTDTPNSLTQEARYYRYIKKAISSPDKPIILFILDDDGSNNSEEFLHHISEQFNQKGKQNKERFIFIAKNQSKAKKMLYSDYTMRNAQVFDLDNIPEIQRLIKKYMEEYCFIDKITNTCSELNRQFEMLKSQLQVSDIETMERELDEQFLNVKELLSQTDYQWSTLISVEAIQAETNKFIKTLENEFNSVFKKSNIDGGIFGGSGAFGGIKLSLISKDAALKNTKNYIDNDLKKRIETFIIEKIKEIIQGSRIEMIFPENLFSLLNRIDLQALINPYLEPSFSKTLTESLELAIVDAKRQETLSEIEKIKTKPLIGNILGGGIAAIVSNSLFGKTGSEGKNSNRNFFEELIGATKQELHSDSSYLNSEKVDACQNVFKENIAKIRPVINEKLISVTSQLNTKLPVYETAKAKMVDELTGKAQVRIEELKKQALISKKVKERLAYLEQLSQKLNGITQL